MKINKIKLAVLGALMVPLTAINAEEAAPAEESGFSTSANVGFFSDYIWRGQSQTQGEMALQGGFDLEHSSGFYAGVWASNVEWTTDSSAMNDNSVEVDFYAGYGFELASIGFDIGILQYYYPGDKANNTADSDATEVYAGISYDFGILSAGYTGYLLVSDEGWNNSDAQDTTYHDFSVEIPFGETGFNLAGHYGIFDQVGAGTSYSDWKVDVSYAFNDTWTVGGSYTGMDEDISYGTYKASDDAFVGYLTASF